VGGSIGKVSSAVAPPPSAAAAAAKPSPALAWSVASALRSERAVAALSAVLDAGGQAALDEIAGVLFGSTQELARLAAVVGGILAGADQGGPEPAGAGAGADADGAMDVEAAADSAQPQ